MSTVTPPRVGVPIAVLNEKTGELNPHPEYVRFFESIFSRIGGATGSSSNDLTLAQFEDAGIEETKALFSRLYDEASQLPPTVPASFDDPLTPAYAPVVQDVDSGELSALRAEVDRLRAEVEALKQGIAA